MNMNTSSRQLQAPPSQPDAHGPPESPPAKRLVMRSRWRDPKLAFGLGLVACSVVIGSWVVTSADNRVMVWSAATDLAGGTELREGDLVQVPVRLDAAASYIGVTSEPVAGRRLSRPVGIGELVPLAAVVDNGADHRLITIPVEPMHGPLDVHHGDRVDVYVSPRDAAGQGAGSRLVLAGALVAEVADLADSSSGEIAVVLDVAAKDASLTVGASRSGVIDLVRVPVGVA